MPAASSPDLCRWLFCERTTPHNCRERAKQRWLSSSHDNIHVRTMPLLATRHRPEEGFVKGGSTSSDPRSIIIVRGDRATASSRISANPSVTIH